VSFKLLQEKYENVPLVLKWKLDVLIGQSSNFHTQDYIPLKFEERYLPSLWVFLQLQINNRFRKIRKTLIFKHERHTVSELQIETTVLRTLRTSSIYVGCVTF